MLAVITVVIATITSVDVGDDPGYEEHSDSFV